jgi:NADPH:quinone reductase-like Zn-dependent oxidoreductase
VPLAALTAWQAFFDHANLVEERTVLIHGAAGGVGVFAVQLAHLAGAHVIVTASARHHDFLKALGADEIIDYNTTRFEDVVQDVDIVLDMVGGEIIERSWNVLKKGGIMVSVANPPSPEQAKAHGVRSVWFIVEPSREQLMRIGALIDTGRIRPIVETVIPLSQASQAYEQGLKGHMRGKIVLRVIN